MPDPAPLPTATEEQYRYVVELSNLNPWIADAEGRIVAAGERWAKWTGAHVGTALADGWMDFVHPDDLGHARAVWEDALRTGRRLDVEYRLRGPDSGYRWCRARAAKRTDARDGDAVWYGTLEDINERRTASDAFQRAQAELVHMSRLSAMWAMAGAIAHDLNQPLTAIGNYVRGSKRLLVQLDGPTKADIAGALDDADRSVVRAGEIVRRVREFVTGGDVERRREDLAAVVAEACRFCLLDSQGHGVSCRTELGGNCAVSIDRVQIQQVIVNLIQNALDAMADQPRKEIVIRTEAARAGYCAVSVQDSGPSVSPEIAARMFDPLFTTRQDGMGVGLSISRMIVEAHGGAILNEPAPGGGMVIRFTVPVASPIEATRETVPAADA